MRLKELVPHDHKAFMARARARKGFAEAYDALELEYAVTSQMLKARSRAGLTQDAVALARQLQFAVRRVKQ